MSLLMALLDWFPLWPKLPEILSVPEVSKSNIRTSCQIRIWPSLMAVQLLGGLRMLRNLTSSHTFSSLPSFPLPSQTFTPHLQTTLHLPSGNGICRRLNSNYVKPNCQKME